VTLSLLDADIVCYQAAAAAQTTIDDEVFASLTRAKSYAVDTIDTWHMKSGCDSPFLVWSPASRTNFRHLVWADYKGGRSEKPVVYWALREYLEDRYPSKSVEYLEADDLLAQMIHHPGTPEGSVIVSIDKDLKTVPECYLLNPTKMEFPEWTSQAKADRWWLTQTLTGDPVDGFKGAKGVGIKAADKALSPLFTRRRGPDDQPLYGFDLPKALQVSADLYKAKGHTFDDFLTNARMARMLRRGEYDGKLKRIKLWHPSEDVWLDLPAKETKQNEN